MDNRLSILYIEQIYQYNLAQKLKNINLLSKMHITKYGWFT